jgi:hypothetical protein
MSALLIGLYVACGHLARATAFAAKLLLVGYVQSSGV